MRVADLLRQKGEAVWSVDARVTVNEAIHRMAAYNIGALLILEKEKSPMDGPNDVAALRGIVSEREIMVALARHGAAVLGLPVAEIMATKVPFVHPAESIRDAMAVMTHAKVRHLPVIDEGMVAGLISIGDVVKSRLDEKTQEIAMLQDMARITNFLAA